MIKHIHPLNSLRFIKIASLIIFGLRIKYPFKLIVTLKMTIHPQSWWRGESSDYQGYQWPTKTKSCTARQVFFCINPALHGKDLIYQLTFHYKWKKKGHVHYFFKFSSFIYHYSICSHCIHSHHRVVVTRKIFFNINPGDYQRNYI